MPRGHRRIPAMPSTIPAPRRHVYVLPALCLVAVLLFGSINSGGTPQVARGPHPVFTVGTLRAYVEHQQALPIGRQFLVRAIAEPCAAWGSPYSPLHCPKLEPVLVDPDGPDLADPLPLIPRSGSTLLDAIRRLPLISQLVPAPEIIQWGILATYRIELRAIASEPYGSAMCYAAVVVGSAP